LIFQSPHLQPDKFQSFFVSKFRAGRRAQVVKALSSNPSPTKKTKTKQKKPKTQKTKNKFIITVHQNLEEY
jgi:hypothetical protein